MNPPTTRILTRGDVRQVLSLRDCITAVEKAFAQSAQGSMHVPPVVHIPAANGAFHVKSAAHAGAPHYVAIKVNGNFPDNPRERGLPTIQGAILLSDCQDGRLLAIMDSIEVTALRTGAATAVAVKHLAPRAAQIACVIGCGIQGRIQLRSVLEVVPLKRIYAVDSDPQTVRQFASDMRRETGCEVVAADDLADAAPQAEIIVSCTPSRRAFLEPRHVSPGTFIAAVGADNPDKQEIEPDLMAKARVVVDSIEQCVEMGDLRHAIAAGAMSRSDVAAQLGAVVAGHAKLEQSPNDIVVFDSTGIAIQDLAAAAVAYERSISAGIGAAVALN